jgi:carbamoyltransferase
MIILGLGGLQGGGACAVLKDGSIIAAIEESKLSRGARGGVPEAAVAECLRLAGIDRDAVDCVAVVRPVDPILHFSLRELFPKAEVAVVEHHLAHAASAIFASPFGSATVLTLDHTGDFCCGARWSAQGNQLRLEKEWQYPDSLAWLYSAVTELLGFHAGADEHKVQWLSASGDDRFQQLFHEIAAASGRLDATFFDGALEAVGYGGGEGCGNGGAVF